MSENKRSRKDVDARWVTKGGQRNYRYKNYIKIDRKPKLIENYTVTLAAVHDSQAIESLISDKDSNHEMFADSAYSGNKIKELLKTQNIRNRIHEKGYGDHPLLKEQLERNRKKSKTRCRVEHVFGCIKNSLKGKALRSIGILRANVIIVLTNLVYNIGNFY